MALPATDNFTRADNSDLGVNWSQSPGFASMRIGGNRACPSNTLDCCEFWNADVFANDQYSEIRFTQKSNLGPAARIITSGTLKNAYLLLCGGGTFFYKVVNNAWTQMGSMFSAVDINIKVKLLVSGTTLNYYRAGVYQGQTPDSALASGAAGLYGSSVNNDKFDFWEGGNVGGAGIPLPVFMHHFRGQRDRVS